MKNYGSVELGSKSDNTGSTVALEVLVGDDVFNPTEAKSRRLQNRAILRWTGLEPTLLFFLIKSSKTLKIFPKKVQDRCEFNGKNHIILVH